MPDVPLGLVILRDQSIFMTVQDWPDHDGKGIDTFNDAYTTAEERNAFHLAVMNKTGLELKDVRGNLVVSQEDADSSTVPERPGVCAFRMAKDGPDFVARNFRELGVARGQEYSVLAVMDDSSDIIAKYRAAYDAADDNTADAVITYDNLKDAALMPVYSSLTITKPALAENEGARAADYGDGAP